MTVGFCGQERCLVDANGRIKLSPRFEQDFRRAGAVEVVLHCLPENALAVYPLATWEQLRAGEERTVAQAATSIVARRQLRRFGAMTQVEALTNQGRVTIPPGFRSLLQLEPGTEAMIVGCETGVEIWNAEHWRAELAMLRNHEAQRAEAEMRADVEAAGRQEANRGT
jgi:division/cell wall cluster transcriptional repressor MraZ